MFIVDEIVVVVLSRVLGIVKIDTWVILVIFPVMQVYIWYSCNLIFSGTVGSQVFGHIGADSGFTWQGYCPTACHSGDSQDTLQGAWGTHGNTRYTRTCVLYSVYII